jgi:hypothetical protein
MGPKMGLIKALNNSFQPPKTTFEAIQHYPIVTPLISCEPNIKANVLTFHCPPQHFLSELNINLTIWHTWAVP